MISGCVDVSVNSADLVDESSPVKSETNLLSSPGGRTSKFNGIRTFLPVFNVSADLITNRWDIELHTRGKHKLNMGLGDELLVIVHALDLNCLPCRSQRILRLKRYQINHGHSQLPFLNVEHLPSTFGTSNLSSDSTCFFRVITRDRAS